MLPRDRLLGPVIALLDDDASIRKLVKESLASEGYDVRAVACETDLNAVMRDNPVDLFILDIILPDSNGIHIAQKIRRESDVGIILLTGQSGEVDTVLGLEVGADDYVTKPFRVREFRARVKSVLRRSGSRSVRGTTGKRAVFQLRILECGAWRLDLGERTVLGPEGTRFDLSGTEFEVFSCLVAAEGRIMSREELVEEIRGKGWSTNKRLIDGVVSRLRKKLSITGHRPPIQTWHGRGYAAAAFNSASEASGAT